MNGALGLLILVGLAGLVLACSANDAGSQAAGSQFWQVPVASGEWAALPGEVRESERPRRLTVVDGPDRTDGADRMPAYAGRATAEGAAFEVVGHPPDRRTMRWRCPVPAQALAACTHYTLRYRARGLARSHAPLAVVALSGKDRDGKPATEPLLDAAHLLNDGLWHRVVAKRTGAVVADAALVQVTTEDSLGTFDLSLLQFHHLWRETQGGMLTAAALIPAPLECIPDLARPVLECLPLDGLFNDTVEAAFWRVMDTEGMVTDGGAYFDTLAHVSSNRDRARLDFVQFRVDGEGRNLIRPAETRGADGEPVEILGAKTTRHYFEPPGRDDAIEIPVGKKVSEAFLLLACELPKGGPRYAIAPGPQDFADIGALSVELRYAGGQTDFAFPYSLCDGGYVLQRMIGAYAVPADAGRVLEKLVVHNHVFGRTFSVAAVTVNPTGRRALPQLAADPAVVHPPSLPAPKRRTPYLRQEGDRLLLGNGFYRATVNCAHGFSLEKLEQQWADVDSALDPASGIEVEHGDTLFTGRAFRTESIQVAGRGALITLQSAHPELPLKLAVSLQVDETPQLRMRLSATNTGPGPLAAAIRFPVLRGLRIGDLRDTWVYFPGYRSIATDRPGLFIAPNDRSFCVQFLDTYNPRAGAGWALVTHDRDNLPMVYSLGKSAAGVSAFVQYPKEHTTLAAGETARLAETCLAAHAGDWHAAAAIYRDWLKSWYRPARSKERDWFGRLFLMRVHLTKKAYSWAVPIFDPKKRAYLVDEAVKVDTGYLKMPPEILHLGGWCDYGNEVGGDFLGGDYAVKDYTGGAEALRGAVRKLQEEHHVPVSLYMIPDRCAKKSEVGRRLGERVALRREDGSLLQDEHTWIICPAVKEWQDHYVEAVRRTQRETGVKAIYVDVFGFANGHRCWSREHGHEVPTRVNQATLALIRRVREVLPPDVAVWSEYPVNDASAQYLDGNIHYYCLYWHEYFGKWRDGDGRAPQEAPFAQSIARYLFPDVRQFIFLCGSRSWSADLHFPFFNGEPLYDTSWFLYAGPHLERIRKSLALQREYADCFTSPAPEPDIPTERAGIHANAFPGKGRTVWTLYNARYTTVRGPMLAVPHRPGATYRDAWNGRPLTPKIAGGKALLSLTLHPQEVGCVVQERQ